VFRDFGSARLAAVPQDPSRQMGRRIRKPNPPAKQLWSIAVDG